MKTNPKLRIKVQEQTDQFPCAHCGAMLKYQPGTQNQVCEYCDYQNKIPEKHELIREYDLHEILRELENAAPARDTERSHCNSCGASFKFAASIHAGECPFCGTDIVTSLQKTKLIHPKSLLPFIINEQQAKEKFRQWLDGLWFAPKTVKKYAREKTKLAGIYLPYWTYDSITESRYTGSRGDTYYVQKRVRHVQNGRMVSTVRRVPKIRWTAIQGRVSRFFDDVLIGASLSLPRQILDRLEPWDLERLVPYDEKYISGFQSELYQIEIDEGFDQAKQVMEGIIHRDIANDIGGDHQRIHQVNTRHSDTTYKHCLLPIWSAAFLYHDKPYRFVINGRTGEVQGERPYRYWKIGLTVIAVLSCVIAVVTYLESTGAFIQVEQIEYYDY